MARPEPSSGRPGARAHKARRLVLGPTNSLYYIRDRAWLASNSFEAYPTSTRRPWLCYRKCVRRSCRTPAGPRSWIPLRRPCENGRHNCRDRILRRTGCPARVNGASPPPRTFRARYFEAFTLRRLSRPALPHLYRIDGSHGFVRAGPGRPGSFQPSRVGHEVLTYMLYGICTPSSGVQP